MGAVVEVRDVWKEYRIGKVVVPALRGVSIDIGESEFVALVGPSGSGKSTLLYLMGGLDKPTKGLV